MSIQSRLTAILVAALLPWGSAFARTNPMKAEQAFAFGQPAREAQVTKTIHVEATDRMRLEFDSMNIERGDVVKFVVKNDGLIPHEFSVGDAAFRGEHLQEMKQMAGMDGMAGTEHADPNVISLQAGETKTLIWRFDRLRTHEIIFACYVPGHYEAGMYRQLSLK